MSDDGTSGDNSNNFTLYDGQGGIYCAGRSVATGNSRADIMLVKYDTTGIEQWTRIFSRSGDRTETLQGITTDLNGDIILTGECFTSSNVADALVAKYASSGQLLWSDSLNGTSNLYDRAIAACVDDSNNVYVTGYVYNGSFKGFLMKYSANGQRQYSITIPNLQQGNGIRFSKGNVLVYGITGVAGNNHHTQLYKIDRGGTIQANYLINDQPDNRITHLLETNDHYYLIDSRSTLSGGSDYAVYCLDTALTFVWKSVQTAGAYLDAYSMTMHDSTLSVTAIEIVNMALFQGQVDVRALHLRDGSVVHQTTHTSGPNPYAQAAEHTSDSQGTLSVGFVTNSNSTGNGEYQLLRYDNALQNPQLLTLPDSMSYGDVHLQQPNDHVIYYGTDIIHPATGQRDFLLYKITDITQSLPDITANTFSVYPNPLSDNFRIHTSTNTPFSWQLHDNSGRLLLSGNGNNDEELSLDNFAKGIYFLKIKSGDDVRTMKVAKGE